MSAQLPLISIVIPAYQAEATLERAVRSALQISFVPIEVIIVDDGSTDNTARVAEGLANDDTRIRVLRKRNGGRSAARNFGIEQSRGTWIMFIDADDYLLSGCSRVLAQVLNHSDDIGLAIFGMIVQGDRQLFTAEMPDPDSSRTKRGASTVHASALCEGMIDGEWQQLVKHPENFEIDTCWARLYRRNTLSELSGALPHEWSPFPTGVRFSEDRLLNLAYIKYIGNGTIHFEAEPIYCWDFGESSTAAVINSKDADDLYIYRIRLHQLVDAKLLSSEEASCIFGAQAIEQFRRVIVAYRTVSMKDIVLVWQNVLDNESKEDLLETPAKYLGNGCIWRSAARLLSTGHVRMAVTLYRLAFIAKSSMNCIYRFHK